MNHLSWDDAWRIVDGEENDAVIALLQHATTCSSCKKLLEEVQSMDQSLQAALGEPVNALQPQDEDALWEGLLTRIESVNRTSAKAEATGDGTFHEGYETRTSATPTSTGKYTRKRQSRSRHLGVIAAGVSAALVIGGVMMRSMTVGPSANTGLTYGPQHLLASENSTATTNAPFAGSGTSGGATSSPRQSSPGPKAPSTAGTTNTTSGIMQSAEAPVTKTKAGQSSSTTSSLMGPFSGSNRPSKFTGRFHVRVVDSGTNLPLFGAKVFVVTAFGVSSVATTARTGTTSEFDIQSPIDAWTSGQRGALMFPYDWPNLPPHGEATVIVMHRGYMPTIMYHIPVGGGTTPNLVDVRLVAMAATGTPSTGLQQRFVGVSYPLDRELVSSLIRQAMQVPGQKSATIPLTPKSSGNEPGKFKEPLTIHVLGPNGKAMAGAHIMVYVDGQVEAQAISGQRGIAVVHAPQSLDWGLPGTVEQSVKFGRVAVLIEKPDVGAWWNFDVGVAKNAVGTLNVTLTNGTLGGRTSTPPPAIGEALLRFVSQHKG